MAKLISSPQNRQWLVRPRVLSLATLAASSCLRSFHLITLPAPGCRLHHSAAACRDPSISIPRPARCDERVTSRAAVTLCHTASRVTVSQLCQSSVPSWHGRLAPRSWSWHIKYQPFIPLSPHPIPSHTRLQAPGSSSQICILLAGGCLAQMCATALHRWKACSESEKM